MNLLHTLRNAPRLAKLALLWFALTLGAAVASPMVQPQQEMVICPGAGMLKVVLAEDGTVTTAAASDAGDALFCPLCLSGGAPVATVVKVIDPRHSPDCVPAGTATAHVVTLSAAPLSARGPPHA